MTIEGDPRRGFIKRGEGGKILADLYLNADCLWVLAPRDSTLTNKRYKTFSAAMKRLEAW